MRGGCPARGGRPCHCCRRGHTLVRDSEVRVVARALPRERRCLGSEGLGRQAESNRVELLSELLDVRACPRLACKFGPALLAVHAVLDEVAGRSRQRPLMFLGVLNEVCVPRMSSTALISRVALRAVRP